VLDQKFLEHPVHPGQEHYVIDQPPASEGPHTAQPRWRRSPRPAGPGFHPALPWCRRGGGVRRPYLAHDDGQGGFEVPLGLMDLLDERDRALVEDTGEAHPET